MYATQMHAVNNSLENRPAQNSMNTPRDIVASKVFVTNNFAQFKFDPFNRPIDMAKLNALKSAIQDHNLLADNPIMVTLDFVVLDGQHRLKAAELLVTPIYYYFASEATIADVPKMNGMRSAWKAQDYLEAWCKRGAQDYIALRDFWHRFDWMTLSMAQGLCHYGDNYGENKRFYEGEYKANNLDFAEKVALAVLDFRSIGFEYWRTSLFISVVANLLGNSDYDHKRMMHQLKRQSVKLRPAVNREDYMEILSRIYNYNRRGTPIVELKYLHPSEVKYRSDMKAQRK